MSETPSPPDADSAITERILVVEDIARMRESICRLIAAPNRQICEAATGAEAIRALESGPFDLVLLDLGLPDMSGLDVLDWMRRNGSTAWAIVVSADEAAELTMRALRSGAVDFVRKMGDIERLQHCIDSNLRRRLLERRRSDALDALQRSQ